MSPRSAGVVSGWVHGEKVTKIPRGGGGGLQSAFLYYLYYYYSKCEFALLRYNTCVYARKSLSPSKYYISCVYLITRYPVHESKCCNFIQLITS